MKVISLVLFGIALGLPGAVATASNDTPERRLSFLHTHTGKTIDLVYWANGDYRPEALESLNDFLSDWRNGERINMDTELLDALHAIQVAAGSTGTFEVISAYRSPQTNEMLRSKSNGVAKTSQHLHGKAIDVRLSDIATRKLQETALALKIGGVGYYEGSDFVHIDTGRVRRW